MNSSPPGLLFAGGPQGWWAGAGEPLPVVLPALFAALGVAGALAPLLLAAALAQRLRRRRRGRPGAERALLLLSLAAADLLLALLCLPARVATYARRSWPLGRALCGASDWLLHACLGAKSLTWAAAAAAGAGGEQRPGSGWGRPAALVGCAWAAALLLPLPHLLFARLEGRPPPAGLLRCLFRAPDGAGAFLAVFSAAYPLAVGLGPAAAAAACHWAAARGRRRRRRLRAQPGRPARPRGAPGRRLLAALTLLFHASWLPLWAAWLWARHAALARAPPPPPGLLLAAEGLVFLDGALAPALLLGLSPELRADLRSLCRAGEARKEPEEAQEEEEEEEEDEDQVQQGPHAPGSGTKAGEKRQALGEPPPPPGAEGALADVEHFWKERTVPTGGEESDPLPWEHQSGP